MPSPSSTRHMSRRRVEHFFLIYFGKFYLCRRIKTATEMFTIIGLMLTGMLLGYLLRKRDLHGIHTLITVLIWVLLFILGIEVGGNEQIIKGLHTIGLEAIVLTVGGTLGSVAAAWALWRALYKKEGGNA